MFDLGMVDAWQQLVVIFNTVLAAILGSVIGFERDRAGKSAGPRTMALVAAGRPLCPFCTSPIDPKGHLCPRANGYRR
mgnify:CR=1 FL=1